MDRLNSIERPTLKAIGAAEAERKGLELRLGRARSHASMLMGNSTFEEREPEVERQLSSEEQTMAAARTRIQQLTAHLIHLRQVLELLHQK